MTSIYWGVFIFFKIIGVEQIGEILLNKCQSSLFKNTKGKILRNILWVFGVLLLLVNCKLFAAESAVNAVLDQFHQAASDANGEQYFSLLDEKAIFIGTDATERWSKEQFKLYALPIFAKGRGWTYLPTVRHVDFSAAGDVAWFDELLDHKKYGECRGTGVLVKTSAGWKISQYHLTFPIPNDIADDLLKLIAVHHKFVETQSK